MAGKKGHRLLVDFACKGCGAVFQDNPSQIRIFCSKICADKYKPKKKKTYLTCKRCGKIFHPISGSLKQRYCSRPCGYRRGRTKRTITITKARNAQSLLRYYVIKGKIKKPVICEECKQMKKIEAAHYNYDQPLRVRWLCISCHRKWDKKEPKGVTYAVNI